MVKGEKVMARLYGGAIVPRRVVAVKENVVVICTEEEYQQASEDGREPVGLGFPKEDVLKNSCRSQDRRSTRE
jgi:hypothetical protein